MRALQGERREAQVNMYTVRNATDNRNCCQRFVSDSSHVVRFSSELNRLGLVILSVNGSCHVVCCDRYLLQQHPLPLLRPLHLLLGIQNGEPLVQLGSIRFTSHLHMIQWMHIPNLWDRTTALLQCVRCRGDVRRIRR